MGIFLYCNKFSNQTLLMCFIIIFIIYWSQIELAQYIIFIGWLAFSSLLALLQLSSYKLAALLLDCVFLPHSYPLLDPQTSPCGPVICCYFLFVVPDTLLVTSFKLYRRYLTNTSWIDPFPTWNIGDIYTYLCIYSALIGELVLLAISPILLSWHSWQNYVMTLLA